MTSRCTPTPAGITMRGWHTFGLLQMLFVRTLPVHHGSYAASHVPTSAATFVWHPASSGRNAACTVHLHAPPVHAEPAVAISCLQWRSSTLSLVA